MFSTVSDMIHTLGRWCIFCSSVRHWCEGCHRKTMCTFSYKPPNHLWKYHYKVWHSPLTLRDIWIFENIWVVGSTNGKFWTEEAATPKFKSFPNSCFYCLKKRKKQTNKIFLLSPLISLLPFLSSSFSFSLNIFCCYFCCCNYDFCEGNCSWSWKNKWWTKVRQWVCKCCEHIFPLTATENAQHCRVSLIE